MRRNKQWRKTVAAFMAGILALPGMAAAEGAETVMAVQEGQLDHVSVHDPSIIMDTDKEGNRQYYIFGTHIEAAKSADMSNWTRFSNGYTTSDNTIFGNLDQNLEEPFRWAGKDDGDQKGGYGVWAPDVKYNPEYVNADGSKGAYMMYFCTSSTYCRSAIAYAVSDRIDGDYQYKGTLVYSGFTKEESYDNSNYQHSAQPTSYSSINTKWTNTNIDELIEDGRLDEGTNEDWFLGNTSYNTDYAPNAIDPTIFTDTDGRMWMTYGSWSGGIFLLEIDPKTGDAIYPKTNTKTEDGRTIDKYFGIQLAGGHTLSGEGPYIIYDSDTGYYYLYMTYNFLDAKSGYNMRLFRSKNPDGPYEDAAGRSAVFSSRDTNQYEQGIKVMGNYNIAGGQRGYRSPGHNSALIDSDGQRYLVYHTRFQNDEYAYETRIHQQFMNAQGWPVTAVFENRGDVIEEKGYGKEEIVGTYEFLNHGTTSDGASVRSGDQIVLLADGTIAGAVTGTWTQKEGSYLASFTVAGTTYHGVFFRQHDETGEGEAVMTFTAIGDNNATIWGVRISDSVSTEYVPEGEADTDFRKLTTQPVRKYTFEDAKGIQKLAGNAAVEDGVLKLGADGVSVRTTYAQLTSISDCDFSKGITLTADVLVQKYTSDWTPVFMIGDSTVEAGAKNYSYHFTQGFSSISDLASGQVGYYGNEISAPYSWDYFSNFRNRNKWYTVTVAITDKRMATYIDGVKVQSATKDYSSLMESFFHEGNVFLGGSFFNDPDFAGWMDNVAIYDRALTDEAVAALAGGAALVVGTPEYVEGEEVSFTKQNNTDKGAGTESNSGSSETKETKKDSPKTEQETIPTKGTKLTDPETKAVYQVTKSGKSKGTVSYVRPKNRKVTSVVIPKTVKLNGISYQVTSVSANALSGCKKLKKLTIGANVSKIGKKAFYNTPKLKNVTVKSKKLKKTAIGTKAFAKLHAKAVVKVPAAKKKSYRSILKSKGLSGKKQSVR